MKALALLAILGACTYDTTDRSLWTIHTNDAACPSPEDAEDVLIDSWARPATRIDGDACTFVEIIEIEPASSMRPGDACCYAATCSVDLNTHDRLAVFDAVCAGLRCNDLDLSERGFSAAKAAQNLADTGLACSVDLTSTPATQPDTVCVYPVTGSYECSTAPG
jgi:hypothetical protein